MFEMFKMFSRASEILAEIEMRDQGWFVSHNPDPRPGTASTNHGTAICDERRNRGSMALEWSRGWDRHRTLGKIALLTCRRGYGLSAQEIASAIEQLLQVEVLAIQKRAGSLHCNGCSKAGARIVCRCADRGARSAARVHSNAHIRQKGDASPTIRACVIGAITKSRCPPWRNTLATRMSATDGDVRKIAKRPPPPYIPACRRA